MSSITANNSAYLLCGALALFAADSWRIAAAAAAAPDGVKW